MSNSNSIVKDNDYTILLHSIGEMISETKNNVFRTVNTTLLKMNWNIGRYIVEYEQKGNLRSNYGDRLIIQLSKDLQRAYGNGYSRSNLQNMRKLYLAYPKSQTLSGELSWSHYLEILKATDPLEISFYTRQCAKEHWSVKD